MTDLNRWFDLYLFVVNNADHLIKISHLNFVDAAAYAEEWFEMNELHDYMLVTENSTPWHNPVPDIVVKSPEWIRSEYDKYFNTDSINGESQ